MQLNEARPGQHLEILRIEPPDWRQYALRLGLHEGTVVLVTHHFPNGPVVLRFAASEIALGHAVARCIAVHPWPP